MWYLMLRRDGVWIYLSKFGGTTPDRDEAKVFHSSAEAYRSKNENEPFFEKVKVRNSLYNL